MKRAFLVAGLAFGDESKGATTDYLTWKYGAGLVVRYNGGSQAAHNVVQPDGRHHTFQQFGSGMFHPGVRTHLSRFMLINPMNMMREEEHLRAVGIDDAWQRTSVDAGALIITPFHRELNRAMTPAGTNSCGQGIGVCREFHLKHGDNALFAGDLLDRQKTYQKLRFIQIKCLENGLPAGISKTNILQDINAVDMCWDWYKDWRELVKIVTKLEINNLRARLYDTDCVVFEGAQGVLLDETHGEPGFNTWTDTTFHNAIQLLDEAGYDGERIKVGVIRTYYTRHGDGAFPTEDPNLQYPEPHNEPGYPGKFRYGRFDVHLFSKALDIVGGVDWLAVNHIDQERIGHNLAALIGQEPEQTIILGRGPTYKDRKEA